PILKHRRAAIEIQAEAIPKGPDIIFALGPTANHTNQTAYSRIDQSFYHVKHFLKGWVERATHQRFAYLISKFLPISDCRGNYPKRPVPIPYRCPVANRVYPIRLSVESIVMTSRFCP